MNTTKLLTVLVAALVVSAGAGAVTAQTGETSAEASIDAEYDDGTVTLTVTQNDTGVENVSVEANDEDVGATDANGTLTFETNASDGDELELELEGEGIDHEVEYTIEDGELVRESDEDDEDEAPLEADVSYDNGTVEMTVTQNGSAVENASVSANDEDVGMTDANGTLTFETNASEELEIEITSGEQELELEYAIEDGELVEDDEEAGPDENASDRAKNVFGVIQNWLDSGQEGNLGQMIQEQLGNGNDDTPGNSGDAPGNSDEAPGNSDDAPGNSDEAPGNSGDAPGQSDDESDDESETEREADEEDDDDDDEEDDEEDDDDEDDEEGDDNPGNGNGNN